MISAVITGGIATGKSSFVAALRAAAGPRLASFSSDEAVREAYTQADVSRAICEAVGLAPVRPEGEDAGALRAAIRGIVTQDAGAKKRLEEVLHPLVFRDLELAREKAEKGGADVFLAEVPLYYESQRRCSADMVIVVAASRETQLRRLISCRGLDQETSERLLGVQFRLEDKVALADKVVWNDGIESLAQQQALTLLRQLITH